MTLAYNRWPHHVFYFQPILSRLFNNCIKLHWYWISFSWNMKGNQFHYLPALLGLTHIEEIASIHCSKIIHKWQVIIVVCLVKSKARILSKICSIHLFHRLEYFLVKFLHVHSYFYFLYWHGCYCLYFYVDLLYSYVDFRLFLCVVDRWFWYVT